MRRKFYEAKDSAPQHAGFILLQIGHLYCLEAALHQSHAGPHLRQARRASHSRPVVERLGRTLRHLQHQRCHFPQSSIGKPISLRSTSGPNVRMGEAAACAKVPIRMLLPSGRTMLVPV